MSAFRPRSRIWWRPTDQPHSKPRQERKLKPRGSKLQMRTRGEKTNDRATQIGVPRIRARHFLPGAEWLDELRQRCVQEGRLERREYEIANRVAKPSSPSTDKTLGQTNCCRCI